MDIPVVEGKRNKMGKWKSIGLYEHPQFPNAEIYGHVVYLAGAGIYILRDGSTTLSCPQDWAAKIHQEDVR